MRDKEGRDFKRKRKAFNFPGTPNSQADSHGRYGYTLHSGADARYQPCPAHGCGCKPERVRIVPAFNPTALSQRQEFQKDFQGRECSEGKRNAHRDVHVCCCCKEHQLPVCKVCFHSQRANAERSRNKPHSHSQTWWGVQEQCPVDTEDAKRGLGTGSTLKPYLLTTGFKRN